jgi:hypothetical protein
MDAVVVEVGVGALGRPPAAVVGLPPTRSTVLTAVEVEPAVRATLPTVPLTVDAVVAATEDVTVLAADAAVDVTCWTAAVASAAVDWTGVDGAGVETGAAAGADETVCSTVAATFAVAAVGSGAGPAGVVVTDGRPARATPAKPAAQTSTPARSAVRTSHRVLRLAMAALFPICNSEESDPATETTQFAGMRHLSPDLC